MKRQLGPATVLACLAQLTPLPAQVQAPQAATTTAAKGAPARTIVRAGKVWIGDGKTLDSVILEIRDGKFVAIRADDGAWPTDAKVFDFRRQALMPGLVAAHTTLVAVDQPNNLTPDLEAVDQFDFYKKYDKLVATGLTTVYLTPGKRRLMPGLGAVVKLAGKDSGTRMLKETAALHVQIMPIARQGMPALFEPTPTPTDDDPLRPSRRQRGTTRASQIAVLERAFGEASDATKERGGLGRSTMRYALAPLRQAAGGTLPVRLTAATAADTMYGLDFLAGIGARIVLDRPTDVGPLAERLANAHIPCIVALPLRPAQANAGDLIAGDDVLRRANPSMAGALARAGVSVAIVPSMDADLDKLRLLGGLAARFGMPASKALAAITLDAARAIGAEARVGSIETGKDADFIVLTGAPFDARSQVHRVFVDGDEVYANAGDATTFAVRAGRILTGDGTEFRNALLIVKGGKIVDVGPGAEVPSGAEVLDASASVLAPGFVAGATKLGLHTDSGTRISATTDIDVAASLDADDPAFRQALEAGITTLFVTPDDSGLVGGRVCAVKTAGDDKRFIVRKVAGLRMTLGAGGKAGKAQLLGLIKKAKAYINPPPKKAAPAKKDAKKSSTAAAKKKAPKPAKLKDVITGKWTGKVQGGPLPQPTEFRCDMKLNGTAVRATLRIAIVPIPVRFTGTFENNKLVLQANMPPIGKLTCKGTLAGNTISGTIASTQGKLSFSMTRGEAPAATPADTETTTPKKKKKKKDQKLEPWRGVLAGNAALVVRVSSADAAQAAIEAIAVESKLKLVLAGNARDVIRKHTRPPEELIVGFELGANEVYWESKGKSHNVAQELTDLGYAVIFVTHAQLGTRYLPVHAAWAVATGFDARRALQAITGTPARCFGLDHRVGHLTAGCDADFVQLSGDPFDLTTRVEAVWVNGAKRFDTRQSDHRPAGDGEKEKR